MKTTYKIMAASLAAALSFSAFANTSTESVPLNKYGAVNVNANVPENIQVPPEPSGFVAPTITSAASTWSNTVPVAPALNVKSYLLLDAQTGNVLASYDANKRIAPASLTKLMLLYIVEQQLKNGNLKLDQKLTAPTVAWATGGSRMFLKPKTEVTVEQLIKGVIVASGNDAAVTLAVNIAGTQSAFVDMMNIEAKKLGMTNTHFSDVMGLPAPNLYTSAHDLGILARHIVLDYPEYYHFFKTKYITYDNIKQPNFNKLLFIDQYADGMKTGSTEAAGYSLVSSEQKPGDRRLISVVIGSTSGLQSAYDSSALLKYGNQFFTTETFLKPGDSIASEKVYEGNANKVELGVANAISLTLPKGTHKKDLTFDVEPKTQLKAPIEKGQTLGTLKISYKGKVLDTAPLIALEAVKEGSLWQRIKGKVALWWS